MRHSLVAVVPIALMLVLPASATAVTRYVMNGGLDNTNCAIDTKPCATIQHAVDEATDGDTISIASGIYNESVSTTKVLAFVGAGAASFEIGGTEINAPDAAPGSPGPSALLLLEGGSLSSLRLEGGDGADASGMFGTAYPGGAAVSFAPAGEEGAALEIDEVALVGGEGGSGFPPGSGGTGLLMQGGGDPMVLTARKSVLQGGQGFTGGGGARIIGSAPIASFFDSQLGSTFSAAIDSGISVEDGAEANVTSSLVIGYYAASVNHGSLSINRSKVVSESNGAALNVQSGAGNPFAEAEVIDSLVRSTEGAAARVASAPLGGSASLLAHGTTFVTEDGPAAVVVQSAAPAPPLSATLRNSIAYNEPDGEGELVPDLMADEGTIEAAFSSFTTSLEENGGSAPLPGSGTNIAGDPGFRSNPESEFQLNGDSPLIDRGDPGIVEPGELDFAGEPRSLDGDFDCIARPDIGAFEVTGQSSPCPPVNQNATDAPPVVSGFGITNRKFAPKGASGGSAKGSAKAPKKGTKFTYTLSEAAGVKITIERKKASKGKARFLKVTTLSAQKQAGKGSTPFSGRVKGKPLKPGKYQATIVATDSAGQASEPRQLSFQIVSG